MHTRWAVIPLYMPELWAEQGFSSSKSRPPIAASEEWWLNSGRYPVAGLGQTHTNTHTDTIACVMYGHTQSYAFTCQDTHTLCLSVDPQSHVHACMLHVAL